MDKKTRLNWIALSFWKGIGPRSAQKLLANYTDLAHFFEVYRRYGDRLELPSPVERSVNVDQLFEKANIELDRSEKEGFTIVTLGDPVYSSLLATIFDAPIVLYARGRLSLLSSDSLAIVGTRYPSAYGLEATEKLSRDLARSGLTIVSGLALGIDASAHTAALSETGNTVAVLGCGLDQRYPAGNKKLRTEIEQKGLVITEFSWGIEPKPSHYPRRNRIISGLSLGTLLIEAREKSGALITINYALDQGREVFAVPGSITSPTSRGAFQLIQQGAVPVSSAKDILNHLPHFSISHADMEPDLLPPVPPLSVEADCEPVWKLLKPQPTSIDEIIVLSGLPAAQIESILMRLELNGLVQQLPGKRYLIDTFSRH